MTRLRAQSLRFFEKHSKVSTEKVVLLIENVIALQNNGNLQMTIKNFLHENTLK